MEEKNYHKGKIDVQIKVHKQRGEKRRKNCYTGKKWHVKKNGTEGENRNIFARKEKGYTNKNQ